MSAIEKKVRRELRRASFLVGEYDPCLLCVNRCCCGGQGCLGWEPEQKKEGEG